MALSPDRLKPKEISAQETSAPEGLTRVLVVDKPRFAQLIGRMLSGSFDVRCADDGPQAAQVFQSYHPDVVVAELDVTGGGTRLAELLDMNVRGRHTPFILTCIKPQAELVEKVKRVGVDALLVKPFPPSSLLERIGAVLRAASGLREGEEDRRGAAEIVQERARWIDGLPELPDTHVQIRQLSRVDGALNRELSDQVEIHPHLAEAVLKQANVFSEVFPRRVATLRQAASLGGFHELAALVLILEAFDILLGYESTEKFEVEAFWKHAVGTAFVARTVAKKVKLEPDICFVAGMLHDAGKVVLDRFFPDYFRQAMATMQEKGVHSTEAELETTGTTHAHVAGYLALNWKLPEDLLEAITCHHNPSSATASPKMASAVHVANAICNHFSYGSSGEVKHEAPDDPALNRSLLKLGVGPHMLGQFIELGRERLEAADRFLEALLEGRVIR